MSLTIEKNIEYTMKIIISPSIFRKRLKGCFVMGYKIDEPEQPKFDLLSA